jgi:hypothetical protein
VDEQSSGAQLIQFQIQTSATKKRQLERFFYFLKWRLTDSAAFAADEFPLTDTNKASHNYTHCCNIELLLK